MNERLRRLAHKAWVNNDNMDTGGYTDLEKFAELIVQECVNVLYDNELWSRHVSHALREHFGVEE